MCDGVSAAWVGSPYMVATAFGVTGWALVYAAFALWEVGGLVFGYPRLGAVVRLATRYRIVRYLVFGMWLWVGWHFLIRGWHFFMRSRV